MEVRENHQPNLIKDVRIAPLTVRPTVASLVRRPAKKVVKILPLRVQDAQIVVLLAPHHVVTHARTHVRIHVKVRVKTDAKKDVNLLAMVIVIKLVWEIVQVSA